MMDTIEAITRLQGVKTTIEIIEIVRHYFRDTTTSAIGDAFEQALLRVKRLEAKNKQLQYPCSCCGKSIKPGESCSCFDSKSWETKDGA